MCSTASKTGTCELFLSLLSISPQNNFNFGFFFFKEKKTPTKAFGWLSQNLLWTSYKSVNTKEPLGSQTKVTNPSPWSRVTCKGALVFRGDLRMQFVSVMANDSSSKDPETSSGLKKQGPQAGLVSSLCSNPGISFLLSGENIAFKARISPLLLTT